MRGVEFPEHSTIFGKPDGWKDADCYGLPVAQTIYGNSEEKDVPCLVSCWEQELTDAEIEEIVRTRKVRAWLSITGSGMPPVSISIETPFPVGYNVAEGYRRHVEASTVHR